MTAENDRRGSKVTRALSIVALSLNVVVLLWLFALALMLATSDMEAMFSEMDLPLPALASFLIAIPPSGWVILFVGLVTILVSKEIFVRDKRITLGFNVFVGALFLMFLL